MNTINITNLPESMVEITGEIPADIFMALWPEAVRSLGEKISIAGFRPGHAPEKLVIEHATEERVLLEMADQILGKTYIDILLENKIDAIGDPEITITKIARGNPLGFKIKTAVMPKFELPAYQKIAKETGAKYPDETEVSTEELEKVIEDIKRSHTTTEDSKEIVPEINDDFVKTLGDFSSVGDFKDKLKKNMEAEKKSRSRDKRRLAIIEAIGASANIDIPKTLIDHELNKMLAEMRGQTESMGLKFEDYLNHIKKTEDELKAAWQNDAKKRVQFGLITHALAEKENIKPTDDEVKKEVVHLLSHNPSLSETTSRARLESYVTNVLTNDLVMKFIDPIKELPLETK